MQSPQGGKKKGLEMLSRNSVVVYFLVICQILWLYTKQKTIAKWNRTVSYFRIVSRMGLRRKKKIQNLPKWTNMALGWEPREILFSSGYASEVNYILQKLLLSLQ